MAWTPPKKITWILSFIFMILGLVLVIELSWGVMKFYSYLPALTFLEPTLNSYSVWLIIGLFLMFFAWLLLILGVRIKGF
ncbi:MAG: hypothetical protein ACTSV5_14465 [Promethearchaeota archaeon]